MADPNTRQGKRTPVTLKIKFKSETLEQFIERYAVDVSQGGIFIRTKEPLAVGTQMKFEFQLRDASPLIAGEGTVVWTRENDPSRPAIAPGMGVRFDRLNDGSQSVLERILAEKAKQAPHRGQTEPATKPPMFTDTPTKVAPAPVQDQLLGTSSTPSRSRHDSEQTPLPKPVPFHSDAEDFDERAFEEATKVRALDELVAQTANEDELAHRRQTVRGDSLDELDRQQTNSLLDRESAPGLPSPPSVDAPASRSGRLLDTTPSPRSASSSVDRSGPATQRPSQPPPIGEPARTRLGVEPARLPLPAHIESTERVKAPRASLPLEPSRVEPPPRPSSAPIVIGILVLVAAAVAGVWFFVLRDNIGEDVATTKPKSGSNVPIASKGTTGSGSAQTMVGSDAVKPAAAMVETVIAANIAATVEVVGSDQSGPAPLTAKLEKDKPYKVKVSAPGYVAQELDVKGGSDKQTAKLVAKPHVIAVSSDPQGAQIYIDSGATGKMTPAEIPLSAAQATKPKLHIQLRKSGYRPLDQVVDASGWKEEDERMVATYDVKLAVMVYVNNGNGHPTGTGSGSAKTGSGTGSAAPDTGSASTGPVTTPDTGSASGAGAGSASGGGGGGGGGGGSAAVPDSKASGEPEPDWSKKP